MNKKYSILIPTYNKQDLLRKCLNSIISYTDLNDVEIIINSNGCTDGTREMVLNDFGFKLLESDKPIGYAKAINQLIKVSEGDYLILLNNDVELLPQSKNEWLDKLRQPFEKYDNCAATGPLELYDKYCGDKVLIFFCVMLSRRVLNNVGFLDESFWSGGEDCDWIMRAKNLGYQCIRIPEEENLQFTTTHTSHFPIYHIGSETVKEFKEYSSHIIKRNGLVNLKKYNKNIKLNLGCGPAPIMVKDIVNIDIVHPVADILMDCQKLDFDENSVAEITAFHLLEHFNPFVVLEILKNWYFVLKNEGKLVMELPNFEENARNFIDADINKRYDILNAVYGTINTLNPDKPQNNEYPHLFGWYPEILFQVLSAAGFKNIEFFAPQLDRMGFNMRVECQKLN